MLLCNSCGKKQPVIIKDDSSKVSNFRTINGEYLAIDNPFKISNVLQTIDKFKDSLPELNNYILKDNQKVEYVKIKISDIPSEKMKNLGKVANLVNYPLDAAILYEPNLTDEKLNEIKGEYFYTYLPKASPVLNDYPFTIIYEVYEPLQTEGLLEVALLFDGGMIDSTGSDSVIKKSRGFWSWLHNFVASVVPTPTQPAGKVTYANTKLGTVGVPFIEVYIIKLNGLPMAPTSITGNYSINSNFYIGGYMFCRFSNANIHVLPVDRTATIPVFGIFDYLTGGGKSSLTWFGKSALPTANFHFGDVKKQANFWCHIVHMDFEHRKQCAIDGILKAPTDLNFAARWENEDENAAGTYMVSHMAPNFIGNTVFNLLVTKKFIGMTGATFLSSLSVFFRTAFEAILPDIMVSSGEQYINTHFVGANTSDYSSDISKTILHELSHASMYNKVGDQYWLTLGIQESDRESGGNYGWGNISTTGTWLGSAFSSINNAGQSNSLTNTLDDFIELSEAWAEFLGENYARRVFNVTNSSTVSCRMCNPLGGGPNGSSNNFIGFAQGQTPYQFAKLADKMEKGHAWADEWIPCGMFHDLMDVTNTDPAEQWDIYGGYTIAEMYNAFDKSRPAHEQYLEFIAPLHGYSYTQLEVLFNKNLKM